MAWRGGYCGCCEFYADIDSVCVGVVMTENDIRVRARRVSDSELLEYYRFYLESQPLGIEEQKASKVLEVEILRRMKRVAYE